MLRVSVAAKLELFQYTISLGVIGLNGLRFLLRRYALSHRCYVIITFSCVASMAQLQVLLANHAKPLINLNVLIIGRLARWVHLQLLHALL